MDLQTTSEQDGPGILKTCLTETYSSTLLELTWFCSLHACADAKGSSERKDVSDVKDPMFSGLLPFYHGTKGPFWLQKHELHRI